MSHSVGITSPNRGLFSHAIRQYLWHMGMIIGVPLAGAIKVVVLYIPDLRKQFKTNYKEI